MDDTHAGHARSNVDAQLLARARRAAAHIAPRADAIERARRLPPDVVAALVESGVFKLLVPRACGGAEASLATCVAVLYALARADGSAGWCAMVGACSGLISGFLPDAVAQKIYGPDDAMSCGVFAPMGRAVPVDGDGGDGGDGVSGYRVSGRWPFASGCQHSQWCMGGAIVVDETPRGDAAGRGGGNGSGPPAAPRIRSVLFHASEIHILDTWDTSGLRGTGSHDFEVRDVVVPADRTFSMFTDRHAVAAYESLFFGILAAGIAAVTLGIARSAIDAFLALARDKRPAGSRRTVGQRELTQLAVARAEARVRAARAFLVDAVTPQRDDGDDHDTAPNPASAAVSQPVSIQRRARIRLAACHAVTEAAAAVDLMYEAGGGSSIYASSPLQRQFRDVHAATQHVMVSPAAATMVGRILLGIETDVSTL